VGAAPTVLLTYYEALTKGIEAMLEVIRPGLPVNDLFRLGVETVRSAGIPHYRRHHVGHGIGLDMYEAPLLVGTEGSSDVHANGRTDTVLRAGMVINIELPYYELGLGGLQIEETLVVRPEGPKLLTQANRELFRCATR
jgi:Xaa-Pro aminopeptidase